MSKQKPNNQYYKIARPDGWDNHTGKTINYRKSVGKTVKCPGYTAKNYECCSEHVIHASKNIFDALFYDSLPCSIFIIEGTPVTQTFDKSGFRSFKVIREIDTSNWKIAFAKTMIYILKDVQQYYDTKKFKRVTNTINKVISIMQNIVYTGNFDNQVTGAAAEAARAARAEAARAVRVEAARAAEAAWSAARAAALLGAAKVATAAVGAAEKAASVAAIATAIKAERDKKFKKYGKKFVEYLQEKD